MLTLERKEEEALILDTSDGKIIVLVSQSMQGKVKLSIDAPREVKIIREELFNS